MSECTGCDVCGSQPCHGGCQVGLMLAGRMMDPDYHYCQDREGCWQVYSRRKD